MRTRIDFGAYAPARYRRHASTCNPCLRSPEWRAFPLIQSFCMGSLGWSGPQALSPSNAIGLGPMMVLAIESRVIEASKDSIICVGVLCPIQGV